MVTSDFLVIGGGIIGLNIAIGVKHRHPDSSVLLIEKEHDIGLHASGRNSGVLHAGFYYTANSLKAKFTREGCQRLTQYCEERSLPINKCGKLVVAQNESDLSQLDILQERGEKNGVSLEIISAQEAREIEPRVKTVDRAIWSPTTASVDPKLILAEMKKDALAMGIKFQTGVAYQACQYQSIVTSKGKISAGYVINASGLYADKIARDFGFSENYRILPFKGLYLYSGEQESSLKTNVYPVPDLRNPFLGVHFTLTVDGKVKIGPTAIPAFWREQYEGLDRLSLSELSEIVFRQLGLLTGSRFDFGRLAIEELQKYRHSHMAKLASSLVKGIAAHNYTQWGKPGIRAQLLHTKEKRLEMDFVIEGDDKSMHVLNAVSPGFTCSTTFSEHVCEKIEQALH